MRERKRETEKLFCNIPTGAHGRPAVTPIWANILRVHTGTAELTLYPDSGPDITPEITDVCQGQSD